MKKTLLLTLTLFSLAMAINAQSDQKELNVGIGLVPTILGTGGGLPISVSLDMPFDKVENMTIGGYLGYYRTSEALNFGFGEWNIKYSVIIFGARGTYHFNDLIENDKIDPYAGLMLGYNIVSSKVDGDNSIPDSFSASASGFGFAGLIGAKYQVSESFKMFGELGYGIAVITLGAVFNL